VADEKLHEADELGNEEDEGENEDAEEGVADDFSNYVAIEDAHGATRECNMEQRAISHKQEEQSKEVRSEEELTQRTRRSAEATEKMAADI
jgi:hypothetical protein